MLKVIRNKIQLTKGDSACLKFALTNSKGEEYKLQDGDTIRLQVRDFDNDKQLVFEGDIACLESGVFWYIHPEDTKNLELKTYYYDAEVVTATGDVYTFIGKTQFTLLEEVTIDE